MATETTAVAKKSETINEFVEKVKEIGHNPFKEL